MKRLLLAFAFLALNAEAQTCEQAQINYQTANGAMVRDLALVERAWRDVQARCGTTGPLPEPSTQRYQGPARSPPGRLVNCDAEGCWGSTNGVRYHRIDGGNLRGSDGSVCARGAGDTFSCN